MSETKTPSRPTLAELTTPQPEATDADYLAWLDRQIAAGLRSLKDPQKRIPSAEVWKAFGLEY